MKLAVFRPKSRINRFGIKSVQRSGYNEGGQTWYQIIKRVHERDGPNCTKCNAYLGKYVGEIHHVVPLSRGGTTTLANLTKLCKDCHDGKHRHLAARRR